MAVHLLLGPVDRILLVMSQIPLLSVGGFDRGQEPEESVLTVRPRLDCDQHLQRWKKRLTPSVQFFFTGVLIFGFQEIFKWFLPFFVQFLLFLHDFEHFLLKFCVLIFHAQSFVSSIFFGFSISEHLYPQSSVFICYILLTTWTHTNCMIQCPAFEICWQI